MAKPQPLSKFIVCTECGLPWEDHKKKTLEECVRLLKAELAKRPKSFQLSGTGWAHPQFVYGNTAA